MTVLAVARLLLLVLAVVLLAGGAYMVWTRRLPRPQRAWGGRAASNPRLLGWSYVALAAGLLAWVLGIMYLAEHENAVVAIAAAVVTLGLVIVSIVLGRSAQCS